MSTSAITGDNPARGSSIPRYGIVHLRYLDSSTCGHLRQLGIRAIITTIPPLIPLFDAVPQRPNNIVGDLLVSQATAE